MLVKLFSSSKIVCTLGLGLLGLSIGRGVAQDVSAHVTLPKPATAKGKIAMRGSTPETVIWLTPVDSAGTRPVQKGVFQLLQKNKQFSPHMLVIPIGSTVEFPNKDPFFHNVFSLYNGKAFDLGLYEPGTKKAVVFDREGVSYIFCNIHPEMGAIILAVNTPYYATAKEDGAIVLHGVAPGRYRLHLWSQGLQPANEAAVNRIVQVTAQGADIGSIDLVVAPDPMNNHKNKFGEDYPVSHPATY